MKPSIAFMLLTVAAMAAESRLACGGEQSPSSGDVKAVAASGNAFGLELYGQLRSREGNLFFSPHSITSALSMLYAGAGGDTQQEIAKVLHFSLPPQRLHPAFAELRGQLCSDTEKENYSLTIVNQLWGRSGAKFLSSYLDLTRRDYGARLQELDFKDSPESARKTINDWVEKQSRGKIENLLAPGALNNDTHLVLTNVIYFLGNWATPFDPDETQQADFHLSATRKVAVSMMHQEGQFGLRTNNNVQALTIPYRGFRLSMVIVLPEKIDGLKALEESLSVERLASWHSTETRQLEVYLPKFKVESQFNLADALKALGMRLAFSNEADFSGMNGRRDLTVTAAVHKAMVQVDETGTEAAAATGIAVGATAAPGRPATFRADHPFLFLVRDEDTGCILFMGRVANPSR